MNDIAFRPKWDEAPYEHADTRDLVALVNDAAEKIRADGEAAFAELSTEGSRWRSGEMYVFVLDPDGNMRVHPDPALNNRNALDLRDIHGKPIIRGLIDAAMTSMGKPGGWYHYQWPVPGAIFPRWKSSHVQLVAAPSGRNYIVGCGMYDDRMEKAFVIHMVADAVAEINKSGAAAFPLFRDPTGPFLAKDAYIFVYNKEGVALVIPPFPNLEGKDLLNMQDTAGKYLIREMLDKARASGSGWIDYMWPKPGESVSTQKASYFGMAKLGSEWVLVGCGVYLADAPKEVPTAPKMSASDLMALVREGAAALEKQGEAAYAEFRTKGTRWFHDEYYFFVLTMDGTRVLLPPDPATEGVNVTDFKDALGRPFGRMILGAANTPTGEGWIHYMFPLPGGMFPVWKSAFVKRVIFPSGVPHAIGCGIYQMQMDKSFIEDVVNRASALIEKHGRDAFGELRDKTGPFVFMDTYVFVEDIVGNQLVNPALPWLEGKNLMGMKDLAGNEVIRNQHDTVMKEGSAWLELLWYKPGHNTPARKQTYVRKVQHDQETFIVGSGIYLE